MRDVFTSPSPSQVQRGAIRSPQSLWVAFRVCLVTRGELAWPFTRAFLRQRKAWGRNVIRCQPVDWRTHVRLFHVRAATLKKKKRGKGGILHSLLPLCLVTTVHPSSTFAHIILSSSTLSTPARPPQRRWSGSLRTKMGAWKNVLGSRVYFVWLACKVGWEGVSS